MLSTKLIILSLGLIKGVGDKSVQLIAQYCHDHQLVLRTWKELYELVIDLKTRGRLKRVPDLSMDIFREASQTAASMLQRCERMGIGTVCLYDDDYPARLRDTIDASGKLAAPLLLYYKGDLSIAHQSCLAVIGTREVMPMGEKAGRYLSREFAKRGMVIVSGLAVGCDTCGHRGALDANGKTIAILANGLDSVYPPENLGLAEEIVAKGGLLLSEYPIGTEVSRYNLVERDRLQAGLSKALLVVQTGVDGGTMHAAKIGLAAHKPVYTIWFQDEATRLHELSAGNAYLVQHGAQYLKGSDNLDQLISAIEAYTPFKDSLF